MKSIFQLSSLGKLLKGSLIAATILLSQNAVSAPSSCDSKVMTSLMPSGSRTHTNNANHSSVFSFDYATRGDVEDTPSPIQVASAPEVGTVWGKAYNANSKKLYVSAFLRRHADLSPDGLGAIYEIGVSDTSSNAAVGTPALWMNLNSTTHLGSGATLFPTATAASRGLGSPFSPSHDVWAFNRVGKQGIGGLELSDDFSTMYAMDMTNRQLLVIDTASKTVTGRYSVNDPGCKGGAGDVRPFGVDYLKGNVYIGVTCSGEKDQDYRDVDGYVMKLSGGSFTTVVDGAKGYKWSSEWTDNPYGESGRSCGNEYMNRFVPIITNMELDESDNMIIGITSVNGWRFASRNYVADTSCTTLTSGHETYGYIVHATPNGSEWKLAQSELHNTGYPIHRYRNGQYAHWGSGSYRTFIGGMSVTDCAGQEVVMYNAMDPLDYESGGTRYMRTSDAHYETATSNGDISLASATASTLEHYKGNGNTAWEKSAGLGDIEFLQAPTVIVSGTGSIIGTVYLDANGNDSFDVSETKLSSVSVSAYKDNGTPSNYTDDTLVATTDTTASGAYSFTLDESFTYRIEVSTTDTDLPANSTIGTTNPLTNISVVADSITASQDFGFDVSASCNRALEFKSSVLESGSSEQAGAIYRFSNVDTGVDALVEILNVSNADIGAFDDTNSGSTAAFQPELMMDQSSGASIPDQHVDFEIRFVTAGTNTAMTLATVYATAVDIDGDTDETREYTILEGADSYTFENPTNLTSLSLGKFTPANTDSVNGISLTNTEAMVTALYSNVSSIRYTTGFSNTGADYVSYHRQSSLSFDCVTYDNPQTEDYYDYGDAPNSYKTDISSNGPSHKLITNSPTLGSSIDAESDGIPSINADGDGSDDDGIQFVTSILPGEVALITVVTTQENTPISKLSGWIDFNGDGDFADANEQIISDKEITEARSNAKMFFNVPKDAVTGTTYARFRITTASGINYYSSAINGEVEDYKIEIKDLASIGDTVWNDLNENGTYDGSDTTVEGAMVNLFRQSDGALILSTITDSSGNYKFSNLLADTYQVQFIAPLGYKFTTQSQGGNTTKDSDADSTTGYTSNIILGTSDHQLDWDAGLVEISKNITSCTEIPYQAGGYESETLSLPKFDSSLGTLTGVQLSSYLTSKQFYGNESTGNTQSLFRLTYTHDVELSMPDASKNNLSFTRGTGNNFLDSFDGIVDFQGVSGLKTDDWQVDAVNKTQIYTPVSDFIAGSSGETIGIPHIVNVSNTSTSTSGNNIWIIQTYLNAGVCVNYTYANTTINPSFNCSAKTQVSWSNDDPKKKDWIAIYNATEQDTTKYLDWYYLNNSKTVPNSTSTSGSITFSQDLPAGDYKTILFEDNGYTVIQTSKTFSITDCAEAFTCSSDLYQSSNLDLNITNEMGLYKINRTDNPYTMDRVGAIHDQTYNALAYRLQDDFIYATYQSTLLRIGSNGVIDGLGNINGLPANTQHYAGTMDSDGFYYVGGLSNAKSDKIYKVDVTVTPPRVIDTITLSRPIYIWDFVYINNSLYGVEAISLAETGKLMKIAMDGTISDIGQPLSSYSFGSVFTDSTGSFFAIDDNGGGFFKIDINTGTPVKLSEGIPSRLNDGANCATATIPAEQPDLSLKKRVANGQNHTVSSNSTITFTLDITNEGTTPVRNIELIDYIPGVLTLNDSDWTSNASGNTATLNAPIPTLAAGNTASIDISFTANTNVITRNSQTRIGGVLVPEEEGCKNAAEIKAFLGGTDSDSTPDSIPDNDHSEDDYDVANINVTGVCSGVFDYGDAPDTAEGSSKNNYQTQFNDNGAKHNVSELLYLGNCVDTDDGDLQNSLADADDNSPTTNKTIGSCSVAGDDEDGLIPPVLADSQASPSINVKVFNNTGGEAVLYCWADYNGNGVFNNTDERGQTSVPNSSSTQNVSLTLPDVPSTAGYDTEGNTYLRCRIASGEGASNSTGSAANGEVEDYPIVITTHCTVNANTTNIQCDDKGTSNPTDDTWSFDTLVNAVGVVSTNWAMSGDHSANGSYGQNTAVSVGLISVKPELNVVITDTLDNTCKAVKQITAPNNCSSNCGLFLDQGNISIDDKGTDLAIDDELTVEIVISGVTPANATWEVSRKVGANTYATIATGSGSQTTTVTVKVSDIISNDPNGFTLRVKQDNNDCSVEVYINLPNTNTLEVNKTVVGDTAPANWEFTLASSNCSLPVGLTNPASVSGGGGNTSFSNLEIYDATGQSCLYGLSENTQAGYALDSAASDDLTNIVLTEDSTKVVNIVNDQKAFIFVDDVSVVEGDSGTVDLNFAVLLNDSSTRDLSTQRTSTTRKSCKKKDVHEKFKNDTALQTWSQVDLTSTACTWTVENKKLKEITDIMYTGCKGFLNHPVDATKYHVNTDSYELKVTIDSNYQNSISNWPKDNNGVGIVFGYQDQDNYYLARWLDYGDIYDGLSSYHYRYLQLIKQDNGSEILLGEKYIDLPEKFKMEVKVDENGIKLKIDKDVELEVASRPILNAFGLYTIDNDDGIFYSDLHAHTQCPSDGSGTVESNDVDVNFSITEDTASEGVDFEAVSSGTVTIIDGEASVQVTVPVIGDTLVEADETFTIELFEEVNGTIVRGTATGTIIDDDVLITPAISIADNSTLEGNSGTKNLTFTVTLNSAAPSGGVSMTYTSSDSTATTANSDYDSTTGTLTIAEGDSTGTINIVINGDTDVENDETFTLTLSSPTNATIADNQATGTIINDDISTSCTVESNIAMGYANVDDEPNLHRITLDTSNPPTSSIIKIRYNGSLKTLDGEAIAYRPTTKHVYQISDDHLYRIEPEINDGRDNTFLVATHDDFDDVKGATFIHDTSTQTDTLILIGKAVDGEGGKTLQFVSPDTGVIQSEIQITGDIADTTGGDNDGTASGFASITIDPIDSRYAYVSDDRYSGTVHGDRDDVDIYRVNLLTGVASFIVSTASSSDYDGEGMSFADDGKLYLENTDDGDPAYKRIIHQLDLATGNQIVAGYIAGDGDIEGIALNAFDCVREAPPIITISDNAVTEGNSGTTDLNFTVTLDKAAPAGGVSLTYASSNQTATLADSDYQNGTGTLTIAEGDTTGTITVLINGDTQIEADETFLLNLSNSSNGILGDIQAIGTIINDDFPLSAVAEYRFEECSWDGTSNEVIDSSGNSLHGTAVGDATTIFSGKVGRAGLFDGSGDYATIANNALLNPTGAFTVSTWANAEVLGNWNGIASKLTSNNRQGWNLQFGNAQRIASLQGNGSWTYLKSTTSPQVDTWYHVVMVHNSDDTNQLYINGTLEKTNSRDISFTDNPFHIGKFYTNSSGITFNGRIDELKIFDSALSSTEVTDIYTNEGNGLHYDGTARVVQDCGDMPNISISDNAIVEGNSGTKTLSLAVVLDTPAPTGGTSINYTTADATATDSNNDYEPNTAGTLTIPAGSSIGTVDITINGDTDVEADETFTVTLNSPVNGVLADAQATGTIINDDDVDVVANCAQIVAVDQTALFPQNQAHCVTIPRTTPIPEISIADNSITEGNSGTSNLNFTITLDNPAPAGGTQVTYNTADATAATANNDYVAAASGTLTIAEGSTTGTISIVINGDTDVESDETFQLNLSSPVSGVITDTQAIGTILNDDVALIPVAEYRFDECLWGGSANEVLDNTSYAHHGKALSGADTSNDSVLGRSGDFSGSNKIEVANNPQLILGDNNADFSVTYWMKLDQGNTGSWRSIMQKGNSGTTGRRTFAMWMRPSDNRVHHRISTTSSWNAGGDNVTPISLNTWTHIAYIKTGNKLDFYINGVRDRSTTLPSNVISNTGDLRIGSNYSSTGIDGRIDEFKIFNSALSGTDITDIYTNEDNGLNYDGSNRSAISCGSPPNISIADNAVIEGNSGTSNLDFTITLDTPAPTGGTQVAYSTTDATATTANSDYNATSGTLSIPSGSTTGTISVVINGDTDIEPDETFQLNLSSPVGGVIADAQAIGTIINDDSTSSCGSASDSNLVGYWPLDDDTGSSSAIDSSGNGNNGTLINMSSASDWVSGKYGKALNFDGNNDTVKKNTISSHLKPATVTVSSWIKGSSGAWEWIAAQGDNYGLFLDSGDNIVMYFHHSSGWTSAYSSTLNFSDNQWHHIAGTYDGSVIKLYFDGVEVGSQTESRPISYTTGNEFTIGSMQEQREFGGNIDDVRVYNRGLTTAEIAELYNHDPSNPSCGSTPAITVSDNSITEGNSGTKSLDFTVTLSQIAPAGGVSVDYSTANGTATLVSNDYQYTNGTLTIPQGSTTGTISIVIIGDTDIELDETLILNLSNAVNSTIAISQVTGTIINDDFGADCNVGSGDFGGTVFQDYNNNGVQDIADIGVANITVTAYDSNNAVVANASSNSSGSYVLSGLSNGSQYRLEFSDLLVGIEPTTSTTLFVTIAASCNADLGVSQPSEFCQATPDLVTTRQVNGDGQKGGTSASLETLVRFPYSAKDKNPETENIYLGTNAETGAVWGMAFQKKTQKVFTSAFLKRHVGFGSLGTGGIYIADPKTNSTSPWVDVRDIGINTGNDTRDGSATNSLPANANTPNYDVLAFSETGKRSIGDIDFDTSDNTLWVVNTFDRSLYRINNILPTQTPTSSDVQGGYLIDHPSINCNNGVLRPWAIKTTNDKIYVGAVCSGESSASATKDDLVAHILSFDPLTELFTPEFNFSINYQRWIFTSSGSQKEWFTWHQAEHADDLELLDLFGTPTPLLSDIEFDKDGSMILAIMDRSSLMRGQSNYLPDSQGSDSRLLPYDTSAVGDLVRVCHVNGNYILEGSTGCESNPRPSNEPNNITNKVHGISGGEYYVGDYGPHVNDGFTEAANGSLAIFPETNEVLTSATDATEFQYSGILWLDNTTGAKTGGYDIVGDENADTNLNPTFFNKGAGIGDIELLCDEAPIEIGNRVWADTDNDGIQDAGELGISNTTVSLSCGSDSATAITNSAGEYTFSNASSGNATFIDVAENCVLSVDKTQASLTGGALSTANTDGDISNNAQADIRDSDASSNGNTAQISFTIGSAGQNNHSLDIGFTGIAVSPPPTTSSGLIAHWKFDEASGSSVEDVTGNGHTGTLSGNPTWVTGKSGTALLFDSNSEHMDMPSSTDFSVPEFTIAMWVKWPNGMASGWHALLEYNRSFDEKWYGVMTNGNMLRFVRPDSLDENISTNTTDWYHITVSIDASGNKKMYLNGIEIDSSNNGQTIDTVTSVLRIGSNLTGGETANAAIDEVRFYNEVLTQAEIQAVVEETNNPPTPNTVPKAIAEYQFDECSWNGSSNEVINSISDDLHGKTYYGASNSSNGKIYRSGEFDGSNDWIRIDNDSKLQINENLTLSLWINPDVVTDKSYLVYKHHKREYALRIDDDKLRFYHGTGSSYESRKLDGTTISAGVWTHIGLVRDHSSKQLKWYINGTLVETDTYIKNPAVGTNYVRITKSGSRAFNGKIDEIKFFNQVLSDDDMQTIFNNENSGKNYDGTSRTPPSCSSSTSARSVAANTVDTNTDGSLTWRSVWVNNGVADAPYVKITAEVPSGTVFVAMPAGEFVSSDGVYCEARGSSAGQGECSYEAPSEEFPQGRVIWRGLIAPENEAQDSYPRLRTATIAETREAVSTLETTAENEVVLRFNTLPTGSQSIITGQAYSDWYFDGVTDSTVDLRVNANDPDAITEEAATTITIDTKNYTSMMQPIPTVSEWGIIILSLLMSLMGILMARRRHV